MSVSKLCFGDTHGCRLRCGNGWTRLDFVFRWMRFALLYGKVSSGLICNSPSLPNPVPGPRKAHRQRRWTLFLSTCATDRPSVRFCGTPTAKVNCKTRRSGQSAYTGGDAEEAQRAARCHGQPFCICPPCRKDQYLPSPVAVIAAIA